MCSAFSNRKLIAAFNRVELLVVMGTLAVLALLAVVAVDGLCHRSREAACLANLKQLGVAMSLYEKGNGRHLPFAFIEYNKAKFISWDRLLYSYGVAGPDQKHLLRCPADTIPANGNSPRRTYSMSMHNMDRRDWPPSSKNATGVGLWWWGMNPTSSVSAISVDMISSPAATLLLTEQAQADNVEFSYSDAAIENPAMQLDTKAIKMGRYHGGKFNYLMVDGHVERLSPLESLGENDPVFDDPDRTFQNIWTIRHD